MAKFQYNPFPIFKAAAVQAGSIFRDAPVYFDVDASLAKAISLIGEASSKGARLIVLSETFLPGYPYWSLDVQESAWRHIWREYLKHSIEVPGPETEALCQAAKKADSYVVIGINERDRNYQGRMFNSILYISPEGKVMGVHRKINITAQELLFHTQGQGGDNLKTVFATEIGNLGGSICGEHLQYLLMYNWIMQGIQVHCSLWPGVQGVKTTSQTASQTLCQAGNCFAVVASTYIPEKDRPKNFSANNIFNSNQFIGGTGIINPVGKYIVGPVYDCEEIVYADINLGQIAEAKSTVNLCGIYSRWDIMNIYIRQEPFEPVLPVYKDQQVLSLDQQQIIRQLQLETAELKNRIAALEVGKKLSSRKKEQLKR